MPLTVIDEPGVPLPGKNAPPLAIVVLPTAPVPISAAFAPTLVSPEDAIDPATSNVPSVTVVGPV